MLESTGKHMNIATMTFRLRASWLRKSSVLKEGHMNERMIYPGKDGIAKWPSRHYFVNE